MPGSDDDVNVVIDDDYDDDDDDEIVYSAPPLSQGKVYWKKEKKATCMRSIKFFSSNKL